MPQRNVHINLNQPKMYVGNIDADVVVIIVVLLFGWIQSPIGPCAVKSSPTHYTTYLLACAPDDDDAGQLVLNVFMRVAIWN